MDFLKILIHIQISLDFYLFIFSIPNVHFVQIIFVLQTKKEAHMKG